MSKKGLAGNIFCNFQMLWIIILIEYFQFLGDESEEKVDKRNPEERFGWLFV
jgi:hypothetical protein